MTEWIQFLQLFVGLSLIATGEQTSCPVELSPTRVVVKYGDPVSVNCSTTDCGSKGIGWEASQEGSSFKPVTHFPWTVKSVTHWNMKPICFVIDSEENQNMKTLDLIIYTFPETISISSSAPSSEMTEKMEFNLTCSILNIAPVESLTVTWYKEDAIIFTDVLNDSNKSPTNQSSILRFTPMRSDSKTSFRCEAQMDLGPEGPQLNASSQKYQIDVLFGPEIECSTIELLEMETLEDKCGVTGNPRPDVAWWKDGSPVNSTVPLHRNDTGTYMVRAEGFILVEKNIQVDVFYGPEWLCPHTYTLTENSYHKLLTCSQGFPKPEETWYKDEEVVELPRVLTRRNAGQFMVTVSNTRSSFNVTMDIFVLYPPSEIFELEDSEVHIGDDLVLSCSSAGYPQPNYSWSYFQMSSVTEETEDGVSHLIIHNATGYNTGLYTCVAWNEHGEVNKTVRVNVKGAEQECPIEITPQELVLQYQSKGPLVECKPTTNETNVKQIFWKTQQGSIRDTSWFADTHEGWDLQPVCHGEFNGIGSCSKALHYMLYKTPESMYINSSSGNVEGTELQLQCDVISVAPAQNLNVHWMFSRGNETIRPESVGLNSNTSCSFSPNSSPRLPVNVLCTMNVTLQKVHDGIKVRCEAELNLGATEPQPPNMTSNTLNITVFYEPRINTTKLPGTIPVFRGYPELLVCEADGNPRPTIHWVYSSQTAHEESEGRLTVFDAGFYVCNATNELKSTVQEVKVILLEDYLPLIAGFVALTVVIISIVFIFIYSIYYKNTKMRRYSLKNPKFSSQNGNVANNGWDMQLPVTKLS